MAEEVEEVLLPPLPPIKSVLTALLSNKHKVAGNAGGVANHF